MFQLDILSDLSERIPYNIKNFPFFCGYGSIKNFKSFEVANHWHQDIEFTVILEGSMTYTVNGTAFIVNKGQGLFINSKRLHSHCSSSHLDCHYLVITINPLVLGVIFEPISSYFNSTFGTNCDDFIVLTGEFSWHKSMIKMFFDINAEFSLNKHNYFKLISYATKLSSDISEHITYNNNNSKDNIELLRIWKMTGFIHENYDKDITLIEIAKSGDICRSQCYEIFNTVLKQTPNIYLTNYRIQKSCELLRNTTLSISEVAISCGFNNSSYFTQVFRKITTHTPKNYRNLYK
ncbi:MAG: helix-turn-helix domain-containing protein [Lachnospirales bacterium]